MLILGNELIGNRVRMKDTTNGRLIADTRITGYDPEKKIIKVSASGVSFRGDCPVALLVFSPKGIFEYFGTLRKPMIANEMDVTLSRGRRKEDRKNTRYNIKVKGHVDGIILEGKKIILRKPIDFVTENISANGLLMKTMAGSFTLHNRIQVSIDLDQGKIQSVYEVVRIVQQDLWTEEYGCRLIAPEGQRRKGNAGTK